MVCSTVSWKEAGDNVTAGEATGDLSGEAKGDGWPGSGAGRLHAVRQVNPTIVAKARHVKRDTT